MVYNLSNRFTPSVLNTESIQLSPSPLDDYQRLFFATVLSKFHSANSAVNVGATNADLAVLLTRELRLRSNVYRSTVLSKLRGPSSLSGSCTETRIIEGRMAGATSSDQILISKKASTNKGGIDCFQMKFPNLYWPVSVSNSDAQPEMPLRINEEALRHVPEHRLKGLCLDTESAKGSMLSANIVLQCERALDAPREDDDPEDLSILAGAGRSTATLAPAVADMSGSYFGSQTLNQEYRANNEEHMRNANTQLINKNNLIIWSADSGYVFLTGIWKMYQDVMRGLILGRRGPGNNACTQIAQELCRYEFEFAVSEAFYKSIEKELALNGERAQKKARKSRASGIRTPACLSAMGISVGPNKDGTACICSPLLTPKDNGSSGDLAGNGNFRTGDATKISYNDIHWTKISSELNSMLIEEFKQSLVEEYGVGTEIGDVEMEALSSLIERIKGGSIKIQGSWAPMKIARSMCLRFCFPIRYMLVPVFGEDFPSDCQAWFERFAQLKNERILKKRRETAEALANQPGQIGKEVVFNNTLSNDRTINAAILSSDMPPAVSASPVVTSDLLSNYSSAPRLSSSRPSVLSVSSLMTPSSSGPPPPVRVPSSVVPLSNGLPSSPNLASMPPSFLDTPQYPNLYATRRNITHGLPLLTTPGAPHLTLASGTLQELPVRSLAFKRNYGPDLDNRFDGFASNVRPTLPKSSIGSVFPPPVVNPDPSYPRMLTR